MNAWVDALNQCVANSLVGRRFRLEGSGHPKERKGTKFLTEMLAGLTTFFAMAYIISVNAGITADSGGPCVCRPADPTDTTCIKDLAYSLCLESIRRDYITGTAAISALVSFCMGLFANMPVAVAPGMGLNAYFAYTVVGFHGTGPVPYRLALTAVFVEGFVFVGLSIFGLRQWLARAMPASIKLAAGAGIGLYLTLIGLSYSAGLGVVTGGNSTPLALGGCSAADIVNGLCPNATKMRSPTMWLGIFCGGFVSALLIVYKFRGAIIIGIIIVSIISWPRNTDVTYFPYTPIGDYNFEFFKKVVTFHPISKTLNLLEWNLSGVSAQFGMAFLTFLYVDILDCTGTLYSMAHFAHFVDTETQDFQGSAAAYIVDALGISIGSLLGLSPVTAFIESGAGITAGGRTGLTSISTGFFFFISIFFAPIFASIPPWATGPTLIMVGAMMASAIIGINWKFWSDAMPAFVTLAVMPFTYSIAYGLISGVVTYVILNGIPYLITIISRGKVHIPEIDHKEPWTWRVRGGLLPRWLVRLSHFKKDFWNEDEDEKKLVNGETTESFEMEETIRRSESAFPAAEANEVQIQDPNIGIHLQGSRGEIGGGMTMYN